MRYRDVERRLAELEAQQAPAPYADRGDADALTDADVLSEAMWGVRAEALWVDGPAAFRSLITSVDRGGRYWQRIADRTNNLCREQQCWLCCLTPDEAHEAQTLLAAGVLSLYVDHQSHRLIRPLYDWHLNPPWQHPDCAALWSLGSVVTRTFQCYAVQTGALDGRTTPMDTDTLLHWLMLVEGEAHEHPEATHRAP